MLSKKQLAQLQHSRKYGIGRLLLLGRRDFRSRLAAKMKAAGDDRLSLSGTALLPYIDIEGTRSSEVARRVGISKQAAAKALKELEDEGLLERAEDPVDKRAFLVSFTEQGVQFLLRIHASILEIEQEYEAIIGKERMLLLRDALSIVAYGDDD